MIQCFFIEALKYLAQQEVFEVDMSFKRVAGPLNEVVFAKFVEKIEHSQYFLIVYYVANSSIAMVFARIFINSDTRDGYAHLFKSFFTLANEKLVPFNLKIQWHHIHSTGLKAIVSDMCHKQASGKFYVYC
jgi:hypothetical protein